MALLREWHVKFKHDISCSVVVVFNLCASILKHEPEPTFCTSKMSLTALLWRNLTFWMCWMKLKLELPTNSMGRRFLISQVIKRKHVTLAYNRFFFRNSLMSAMFLLQPTWIFCTKWKLSTRPYLDGRQTHLQPGSGMISQPEHKTTSASLRTTLEFPVCLKQKW